MEALITLYNNNIYDTILEEKSLDGNQKNIPQHSVFYLSAIRSTVELAKQIRHQHLVDAAQYQHSHNILLIL